MIRVQSAALVGASSLPVVISAVRSAPVGISPLVVLGLPDGAAKETRVRVRSALANVLAPSDTERADPRYTDGLSIEVSPAQKSGSALDLPIAVAALRVLQENPRSVEGVLIIGELSLSGEVRPVRGVLAHLLAARERGLRGAIVPHGNAETLEASRAVSPSFWVRSAGSLADVVAYLKGGADLSYCTPYVPPAPPYSDQPDFADVRGNPAALRALEIAAAGGHSVLLVGTPGSGKTMLARRLTTILPAPTADESLELASIAGVAGLGHTDGRRPFRAPHHTASEVACVGGGDPVRPGEVTLAHGGVLFLDELPEFRRATLEGIKVALREGVSRVRGCSMPAKPLVVAAMNPCPCGFAGFTGGASRVCTCSKELIGRWRARVGTPFDLTIQVHTVRIKDHAVGESSATIRARVEAARAFATARGGDFWTSTEAARLLNSALEQRPALPMAHVVRIARTIADLAASKDIHASHIAEALCLVGL